MNFSSLLMTIAIVMRGVVAPGLDLVIYKSITKLFVKVGDIEKSVSVLDHNKFVSFSDNNPLLTINADSFERMFGPYDGNMKVYYKTGNPGSETEVELKVSPTKYVYMAYFFDFPSGEPFKMFDQNGHAITAVGMTEFSNKAQKFVQVEASEIPKIGETETVLFFPRIGGLLPYCSHQPTTPKCYRFDFS